MTTEQNGTPAEPPADTRSQETKGKKIGCGCLTAIFAAALVLFIIFSLPALGTLSPKNLELDCRSSLEFVVYRNLVYDLSRFEKEGREFPPDWTIPAMVQEMYDPRGNWRNLFCPVNAHHDPYLAFPAPVSVLLNPAEQEPVPVLMCRPGNHGKYGTPVLYSDGTIKSLTTEEAKKLVAEQSPVPLKIRRPDSGTGQKEQEP